MRGLGESCLRQIKENGRLRALIVVALIADLVFFVLHAGHVLAGGRYDPGDRLLAAGLKQRDFSIIKDGSYAEIFEYLLLAIIVVALARLALTLRRPVYFAFLFIFFYYLADDSLQIHETVGAYLTRTLDFQAFLSLRAQDLGELSTWALFGVPLLGFLAFALWRSTGLDRSVGLTLTGWFLLLAFFGGIIDMVTTSLRGTGLLFKFVAFVEDAGEMLVVTAILALTLSIPRFLRQGETGGDDQS